MGKIVAAPFGFSVTLTGACCFGDCGHLVAFAVIVDIASKVVVRVVFHSQAEIDTLVHRSKSFVASANGRAVTQDRARAHACGRRSSSVGSWSHEGLVLMGVGIEAGWVVGLSTSAHAGVSNVRDILQVHGEALLLTREAHVRALDTEFLNADHQGANELVATSETETFVLPVGLVEEDDVESH